jgi:hypothetical protein
LKSFARQTGMGRLVPALAVAIVVTLIPLGCGGSGPEKASVYGKVTYKGQPVPKGTIAFVTTAPNGRNATGAIGTDGSYTLQTEEPGDGALLGDYKVTISARDDVILDYIPPKPIPPKRLVPEKYENPDASGLKATVKSGKNPLNFELVD